MTDPSPFADPEFPAEPAVPPEPAVPAEPASAPPPSPADRPARVLAALATLGVIMLAAAGVFFYFYWLTPPPAQVAGVDPTRVAALEGEVRTLQQRLAQLEQRPPPPNPPAPPDLRPLEARIAALEQRPAAAATAQPDLAPLLDRIAALERRATQSDTAANRADRALRIEAAAAALAAGQPLGTLPDAPPALTRFATEKPPTLADMRLAFPATARRAADASRPATASQSMAERMWLQIASLVSIRSGDHVILGAPAGVVLDAARARLDAGDLAGAVSALDALDPGAAQAMAEWRGRAQSLLDARAALASMARG